MSDIVATPILSRQAITLANVTFLDRQGVPYTPSVVEKKVLLSDGTIITNWLTISAFSNGDDIPVTATEMAMQNATAVSEKHIVLVVGDRNTSVENPLRIQVQVKNRELLP